MKNVSFFTIVLSLMLLVGACSQQSKEESREAVESVKKDLELTKTEFVNNVEEELDSLDNQMQQIQEKIGESTGDTQNKLQEQWEALGDKKDQLENDLEELRARSEENWQELKEGVDDQLDSLKQEFKNLKEKLG